MSTTPVAGRAIWFFVSNVVNAGITFMTMILLARILSPTEYGVLAIFFTFTAVLTSLIGLSLDGSISVAYFKRSAEEVSSHVSSSLALIAITFVGLTVLIFLLAQPLTTFLNLPIEWLIFGLVCSAAQAVVNIKLTLWMVKGAATRYATFQIMQSIMLAGLTAAMIFGVSMTWESRACALVVTNFITACISVLMLIKDGECSKKIYTSEMRLALRFGVPLLPHMCGILLFSSADRFIVNGLLGPAATGQYQLAAQIGLIVLVGIDAINKAFSPWLYNHLGDATDANRRYIVKLTYLYFAGAIIVSAMFFLLPWNIASLFGGEKYSDAGTLVPYFILGQCLGGMYYMVVNYIFYTGRTGYLSVTTLISGLIGIVSCYTLIDKIGLIGAAIAFVISKIIHFMLTWIISARIFPMPWRL
jgi:O-antigen/teichoic acid export membrane protein